MQCDMEDTKKKYILVGDRVGYSLERNLLALGLSTKATPTQVLRGELLEALPEAEQPTDLNRIALVGIERKSLRLECPTTDLARLSDEEASLLLAISSSGERYRTFIDRKRLDFGRRLSPEIYNQVFVSVKGFTKDLPGVVWYKGEVPSCPGTSFGVELIKHPGQGTSDGTFRNKRYFTCPPDSGVFVGLDKLRPREDPREDSDSKSPPKSPKRDENVQGNFKSRIMDTVMPSFLKGKSERKSFQERNNQVLEIDQRVVTFIKDSPARGTVRYIGQEEDGSGKVHTIVGLEMDKRVGSGTGKRNGRQLFVCKRDFGEFVLIGNVIREEDFDENPKETSHAVKKTLDKQDAIGQQIQKDELLAKSMSYDYRPSGGDSVRKVRRTNSVNSADVIMAAGESSQTDTSAFIEQQRQLLNEANSAKTSGKTDNDGDVDMQDKDRSSQMDFKSDHFMPPSIPRDDRPITKQPGLFKMDSRSQAAARQGSYPDFVHIENEDYEKEVQKHEARRTGDSKMFTQSNLQNSTTSATFQSRCSDEVMQQDMGENNKPPLAAEVVSDCCPKTNEKYKEPSEQREIETAVLHSKDSAADRPAGFEDTQMPVDIPHGFEVGSMVEVPMTDRLPRYGVIRWIGMLPQLKDKLVAGLELEDEHSPCSDGTFGGQRYFTCPAGRGFFTLLEHCRQDSRFAPNTPNSDRSLHAEKAFGSLPSPAVKGITMPPKTLEENQCGNMHGLQGHHNSCYLDATLYSMFAFSSVFDTLLHRQKKDGDLDEYEKVQTVLRECIVNPLRVNGFVRADRVLQLRELLDKLSSTAGLVNEEKDPEEFLHSLLQQVLKADPFLHLKPRDVHVKDNEGAFFYQIITEKEKMDIAQVQHLLVQSFISADLTLSEIPSCLILQMPRFGSRYKMYDMILPNRELDVTHIVENVPRACAFCGKKVALYECKECYKEKLLADYPGITSYCKDCSEKMHTNEIREHHKPRPVLLSRVYSQYSSEKRKLEKQKMELFAVVCIETSHYVAFVKCGVGADAPWCFFDSMADRKGERNGYNIPNVSPCPEALEWLSKDPKEIVAAKERGEIPEKVRRLLGDGYLCMYQNLDMAMYK